MDNEENKLLIKSPSVESTWTEHDHWLFLNVVANLPENITGRWQKVSEAIPGKTADEVKAYHDWWEHKLTEIEDNDNDNDNDDAEESSSAVKTNQILFASPTEAKHEVKERKKGTPWTVEEHRRFLEGLKIYGKGDWRSISRLLVVTRTATQVASHAQKYFLRQKAEKKQKKRSSIHDITITEMETAMVVHAQPTPSPLPPPTPPPATSGEKGVPTPPTSTPLNFDDGQRRAQQPLAPYSPLKPTKLNFYAGEGSETQSPLAPAPISCYVDERGGTSLLPPSNSCFDFYDEQVRATPMLMGNQFQNFIYQPY